MKQLHVRCMIRRDMRSVLQIEQDSFEYCWTEDDFLRCLRQCNIIGKVAEVNDGVVGYVLYELHKRRIQLLNFAVDPAWRRRGVGRAMVKKLVDKLVDHRRKRLTLHVRERNLTAQIFFRSCGFHATGVVREFYDENPGGQIEDAYRFVYEAADDFEPEEGTSRHLYADHEEEEDASLED